jgi:hypothetical protein
MTDDGHDIDCGAMCPACGCDEVSWMAPLGAIWWAACRHCGMEYRPPAPAAETNS